MTENQDSSTRRWLSSATVPSPVGPFTLVACDGTVRAAGFTADTARLVRMLDDGLRALPLRPDEDEDAALGAIADAVRRYFAGEVDACDGLPVEQPGGPFTTAAWEAMRAVPAGSTVTYQELAARAGGLDPADAARSARAAGAACAGNRIALLVPCHRILRTGGGLGGFLWGLPVKRWLLDHERAGSMAGAGAAGQLSLPLPS